MIALNINADNRILSAWKVLPNGDYDGMPIVDTLPEGNLYEYRYENGKFVHDPLSEPEQDETEENTLESRVETLEEALKLILAGVTE